MVFYPGVYDVSLKVSDSVSSDIFHISSVIKVYELPQVNFTADITSGCFPLEVSFEDLSLPSSPIVSWFWDFGDGGNDTVNILLIYLIHPQNMIYLYLLRIVINVVV